ncbi:MAG: hypothetical protein H7X83_10110 [Verrucomicrobia bacterium]|nr:hypothetical protein [Deltaproteobacteria bacterium]
MTRAQFGAHVFTNSLMGLTKAVHLVDATSTRNKEVEPVRKREPTEMGAGLQHSAGELAGKSSG